MSRRAELLAARIEEGAAGLAVGNGAGAAGLGVAGIGATAGVSCLATA